MKIKEPNTYNIQPGMTFIFTATWHEFKVARVTDTNISWYVNQHKGGNGINNLKTAWMSLKRFNAAIKRGSYIIK